MGMEEEAEEEEEDDDEAEDEEQVSDPDQQALLQRFDEQPDYADAARGLPRAGV